MSTTSFNGSHLVHPRSSAITCFRESEHTIMCNGTQFDLPEPLLGPNSGEFWIYITIYVLLVLFAGMMAGLVLAIMSIDSTSLKVLIAAGTPDSKKYAMRIAPFVKRHHLVLVTLVLANAAAVESMPIFLDRISDPITAVLVSSTAVLIFGEVLPQAVCSRYGLAIGYHMSWLVWTLIGLFFPIAWPFANLLDFVLGRDHGTFYRRKELSALVDIHGCVTREEEKRKKKQAGIWCIGRKELNPPKEVLSSERLSYDEVIIIKGALEMSSKKARHAMVPLPDVYMLSIDSILDENLVREIFDMGHSRVPVYFHDREHVLGVFLTKRLITIDPKQDIPLKQVIEDNPAGKTFYPTFCVDQDMPLYELLNRFQVGIMTHMAFVTAQKLGLNTPELVGIVTMEDVIEELLQEEIYDEADVSRTNKGRRLQLAKAIMNKKYSIEPLDPPSIKALEIPPEYLRRQSAPTLADYYTKPSNTATGQIPHIQEVTEDASSASSRSRNSSSGGTANLAFEKEC